MIVWLNGPFGGGKTQIAYALHRRLPGSVVCDPEHLGFGLHRMTPAALRGDFQDLPAWRQGVFEVLDLAAERHPGAVLVPMTVTEPAYFAETVGRLSRTRPPRTALRAAGRAGDRTAAAERTRAGPRA